ncbi:reverse transcriptase domain-containing protein [Tanacetum coccineum]|uniref:Reverse transcriptase domain-containing protein n=1 Tax=Tanacetum coccineum TaxID=301880 RepID=A0ABQ4YF96_9ASTR
MEGAPECIKISGFMHGITHPELIKCLYEKIPRSMDEMYRVTTSFLQGEVVAFSHSHAVKATRRRKQAKFQKGFQKQAKAPPPMVTPAEKRDPNKYCEFHADTGHSTDECMQLRKQIDEMIKSGEKDITEGPMIIEAEIGGHFVHRIYLDGGASSEVLYEHCFIRLRPKIRSQMIPTTTSLIGFSGETIWPLGQISLLVKIGDEEHSTSAWMNFMVIRSQSQHNVIIGRTGIRKIRAVPSTAHGMLKFPVEGGTLTLQSSRVIPMECAMISGPSTQHPVTSQVLEEKIKMAIHPEYPEQTIAIGSTLTEKERKELCALLKQNLDIFAWKPADMTGVPRHIAEHRLNVREGCLPIKQKKRGQAPERNKVIPEEVEKLIDAEIMKEVHYHSWLSNPFMVKKHDGSWRMCVDFKDLNKACPKDGYPLPEIDRKVESLCGYPFKCFMDAYKGYHQIKMAEEDEEKTTFIMSQGILCYSKMPFGLKNARATYQRLVDGAFQKQIGHNLEVYVDDLVIKSHTKKEIIRDVAETFKTLRQINMKLNLKKCTFGMQDGMFLGYKVNAEGLKVCPDKADAVLSFPSPGCLKDVQKLNGKLANEETHRGAPNADRTKGKGGANHVLSRGQGSYQCSLNDRKRGQANASVLCEPRPTRVEDQLHSHGKNGVSLAQRKQAAEKILPGTHNCHGSSCIDGFGAGLILTNPEGVEFTYAMRFRFEATNNEAEYEALIAGLRIAEQMGVKNLQANVDSRLVANQVNGSYVAKESGMVQYLEKVKTLTSNFKEFSIKQVPRSENKKADALSKIASTSFAHLSKQVLVEELNEKSINEKEVLAIVEEEGHTWMTPICEYLTKEILPKDKKKARAVRRKASRYAVINGTLYKKSFLGPWLRCVGPLQANYVLREIHEGSCSMHSGPRSVVAKAIRTGYYWPTMHTDARKLIRECNDCQVHRPILRNPQQNLTPSRLHGHSTNGGST